LKLKITKKLKLLFKYVGYSLYKIIYGDIKEIIYSSESKKIKVEKIKFSDIFIYRIFTVSKCRLYNDTINTLAIITDNKLVEGPSYQFDNAKNSEIYNNFVVKNGTPRLKKKIKGSILVLLTGGAGNENYWHWLFDVLPRLAIAEKKKIITEIDYFLLPNIELKFQIETLNALNIPQTKRLSSKKYRHLEADEVIVTDHPYVLKNDASKEIQNVPDWIIKWLRNSFLKNSNTKQENLPEKIYIDRSDSRSNLRDYRKITNEAEVKEILIKNGFTIVTLANLDFKTQVNLFNNATHIVGLHGAGFANLVFCKPKTKILELTPNSAGPMYKNLAIKNNLIYQNISVIPHQYSNNNQNGLINIPTDLLKKKLNFNL